VDRRKNADTAYTLMDVGTTTASSEVVTAPSAVSAAPSAVSAAPSAVSAAPSAVSAAPSAVSAAPSAVSAALLTQTNQSLSSLVSLNSYLERNSDAIVYDPTDIDIPPGVEIMVVPSTPQQQSGASMSPVKAFVSQVL
jgi:hypothetical protein